MILDLDDVLNATLQPGNDAGAGTVREYLVQLLALLWEEEGEFSGKRPFGNSDWQSELISAVASNDVEEDFDWLETHQLIADAIQHLE